MERLSGLDASFLYLETPSTPLHVAMLAVLDPSDVPGGYSFEKVFGIFEERSARVPPMRRRLAEVPLHLDHPVWVEDPDFDAIHHVRRIALPAPGGPQELGAMAGRITSTPLDRSRPLWEAWVIEGLQNGNVAVLAKMHHSAVDGASGAGLLIHFFDLQPDPGALPPAPERDRKPMPSSRELLADAVRHRLSRQRRIMPLASMTAKAVKGLIRLRRDDEDRTAGMPLTAPRVPFNGSVTARRDVGFARVSLDGVKQIKRAFGTTVNDVVLAICAGALRRYLLGRDALPEDPLIAAVPISVHAAEESEIHNRVSAMFTALATQLDDPVARLQSIQQVTRGAKEVHQAIGADMLQSWAEFAAPNTFNLAARFYTSMRLADRHRPIHNLVISNVPGPQFPLYLAGARVVSLYPLGPVIEGTGLNATVLSYCGFVDFGFMVSADLMPDVWDLADAVEPAYRELLDAATDAAGVAAAGAEAANPAGE